jgi:hypothetical protein
LAGNFQSRSLTLKKRQYSPEIRNPLWFIRFLGGIKHHHMGEDKNRKGGKQGITGGLLLRLLRV